MKADARTSPIRLAFAAIQPILYGWAIVVVLGIFAYTVMADSPALGTTSWQDVAGITTGWWLTAFGGSLHFDGVAISLPPLLITLLTFVAFVGFVRKLPVRDWIDILVLIAASAAVPAVLGQITPTGTSWWQACIGAATMAFLAVLTSKNRTDWLGTGFFTTPAGRAIYDGLMLGRRALAVGLILATLVFVAAVIAGWSQIVTINSYYILEWHSNVMLWVFQLSYLPTFILWTLAYLAGAGFSIGTGSSFSVLGVESAPLPAIPLFGALPQPGDGDPFILAIVVLVLLFVGMRQARAFPALGEAALTGAIQVGIVALGCSFLALASRGSIGPERMSETGAEPAIAAGMGALILGVPFLLGMILAHRTSVAKYREVLGMAKDKASTIRAKAADSKQSVVAQNAHDADDVQNGGSVSAPVTRGNGQGNHHDETGSETKLVVTDEGDTMEDNGGESPSVTVDDTSTAITAITARTAPDAEGKKND